jgi:hypothetical protein
MATPTNLLLRLPKVNTELKNSDVTAPVGLILPIME